MILKSFLEIIIFDYLLIEVYNFFECKTKKCFIVIVDKYLEQYHSWSFFEININNSETIKYVFELAKYI